MFEFDKCSVKIVNMQWDIVIDFENNVNLYTVKNIVPILLNKIEATICVSFLSILNSFYSCLVY